MLPKNIQLQSEFYRSLLEDKEYKEALDYIRLRRFTKYDHKLSYRELNHWSTLGLLFEQNEKGKWRRFNLSELLWIELIKELREYQYPLQCIKKIKESLSLPLSLASNVSTVIDHLGLEQFEEMLQQILSEEEYQIVINSEQHRLLIENKRLPDLGADQFDIPNLFELIILEAYFLKIQYRLVVNHEGEGTFTNELFDPEVQIQDFFKNNFQRSNLSVSLNALLAKFVGHHTPRDLNVKWRLIDDKEEKLLDSIKGRNLKSATIRFKNSEIDLIELKEEIDLDVYQRIKEILVKGAYEEIRLSTQSGEIFYSERTSKIKF